MAVVKVDKPEDIKLSPQICREPSTARKEYKEVPRIFMQQGITSHITHRAQSL